MAAKNSIDKYIDTVEDYFKKLPQLPKGGREFIVMVLPWVALIFGILGLLGAISSLGLFSYFSAMYWGAANSIVGLGIVSLVLGILSALLLLMAFLGLSKKQERGWKFIYYSEVVALVSSIVTVSLFGVIMVLLGFYILYQVRSYYK